MGSLTESNLITLDTPLKTGQRCIRVGDHIIPVGVGGMYEPSVAGGGATDFYKCASVDASNSTWTGYKAVLTNGVYSFESTVTSGLTYNAVQPSVGSAYSDNGRIKASNLYSGIIPAQGLIVSALPDLLWTAGQSVAQWGDFSQTNTSYQPQIATINGVSGIKARYNDQLKCNAVEPTGDFSFLAKFYIGNTSAQRMNLLQFGSSNGAIIAFENVDGDVCFLLSKQGVSYIGIPVTMSDLGVGIHTAAVTFEQSTGETKFYFDGVLNDTKTYNPTFAYYSAFWYSQSETSNNLILGLAAYNRVLTSAEVAGINW